ncbi:muropeptide MFS transporter AmpG [Candidatus Sodalis endolongispinus]|uniref:Muropeptide MFS transporter AmpG n=1 Tax=Candidatus Sodalis endolongispinus TaxID=2812662 RepID=A0ABS5YDA1_9GAMM|nr:muropeptide MFS transporter AmpG [Candidatus Sodalis endolongispinus]MBT9432525.1 muropeptide MFS transporter AmpG [Candidatus Sodalis endolongispinus]
MTSIRLATLTQRRSLVLLCLGFASVLPLALTSGTLQAWMTVAGLDLKTIGFFSLVWQAYVFKFLWSPVMDRYSPPLMGRRRGWLVICQLLLIAGLLAMGTLDPVRNLAWLAAMAVWVAFCSVSQDIVFDAYKTDLLPAQERGTGAAVSVLGYRLAMLVSGGLALWLADRWLGWQATYWLMAALMLLGLVSTLLAPEPDQAIPKPASLEQAVMAPLRDFFGRDNAWLVLMLIVLYKLGDAFALSLSTTFLIRVVGFDAGQVGMINKNLGLLATLVGTLAGGLLMQRLSLFRAFLLFGLLQAVSNAGYWALAVTDKHLWSMAAAVFVENLCGGMGTAAFVALLMTLCNKSYSATQFALLSALAAVGRVYVGPLAGWFVESHGWSWFYLFSVAISFPGLGLLMLCRTTLTVTQQTGDFLRRGHFSAGYRLSQRLLAAGGALWAGALVLVKATGWVTTGTMMNLCWEIGALLLTVSILMGCTLDYRAMKRSR